MSELEQDESVASEPKNVELPETEIADHEPESEQKMVPLAALQAERRKRQDLEARARVYEEMMQKNSNQTEVEPEDPDQLLTKGAYGYDKALTKREILEQVYQELNPVAVQKIEIYLKPILDKKPWLASTIDNSVNRLARAAEIVEDYMHLVEPKKTPNVGANDAKKIVQNSQKPRSPVEIGKTAQMSNYDYLKSMQGKKEFREYRDKMRRGEA